MINDLLTTQRLLAPHRTLFKEMYGLRKMGIFGSVARGDASETSDVDILIELSRPISLFKLIELEERLEMLLKRDVDVVTVKALKPLIKDRILAQTVYV